VLVRSNARSTSLRLVPLPRYAVEEHGELSAQTASNTDAALFLHHVAGEGDHAKHGGGGVGGGQPQLSKPTQIVMFSPPV
jgi:hypothetical protein